MIPHHPRIRGEHPIHTTELLADIGSSPHSRGTPCNPLRSEQSPGIIPAFAGNTHRSQKSLAHREDHPRIRGEHGYTKCSSRSHSGSSPHSRGTRGALYFLDALFGIIPAFAGNTYSVLFLSASTKDHPRIRGEHGVRRYYMETGKGSSPHSRGTHIRGVGRDQGPGIIPAFAGNTNSSICFDAAFKDHPRIRGEHKY